MCGGECDDIIVIKGVDIGADLSIFNDINCIINMSTADDIKIMSFYFGSLHS